MSCSQNCAFGDKERMTDFLSNEKFMAAQYCAQLSEAATPEVVRCLAELSADTHNAQQQLFQEMNSRGWYPVAKAQDQELTQAKQKFGTMVTR